jgi:hypothetical protein
LRIFNQWLKLENPTCFNVAGELYWRIIFLNFSAAVIFIVCSIVLGLSRLALTDRAFLPEELVKKQRSKFRSQVAKAKTESWWLLRKIFMWLHLVDYVGEKCQFEANSPNFHREIRNCINKWFPFGQT